jgi:NADH-quinone oxidoreductase subunit B
MEGLLMLQELVGRERRPLSWVAGGQHVEKGTLPVMKDLKRPRRQAVGELLPPDEI